jgi:hypothetical protein
MADISVILPLRSISAFALLSALAALQLLGGCPRPNVEKTAAYPPVGDEPQTERVATDQPAPAEELAAAEQSDGVPAAVEVATDEVDPADASMPEADDTATAARRDPAPPYITLSGVATPERIELPSGIPVTVYFEVPPGYPATAWIGQIPVEVTSRLEGDNDAAKKDYRPLDGQTKGALIYKLVTPGDYVFRIFASDEDGSEYVAESERFTVLPKPSTPSSDAQSQPAPQ